MAIILIDSYGDANTGNGTQNDSSAINAALAAAQDGDEVRATDGKVYTFGSQIAFSKSIRFRGMGAWIKPHSSYPVGAHVTPTYMIASPGSSVVTQAGIVITKGSNQFRMPNANTFLGGTYIGSVIFIQGPTFTAPFIDGTPNYSGSYFSRVVSVVVDGDPSGDLVTCEHNALCGFTTHDTGTVRRYAKLEGLELEGWTFDFRERTTGTGVAFSNVHNAAIRNCTLYATVSDSATLHVGFQLHAVNSVVEYCKVYDGKYATNPNGGSNSAVGYGISVGGQNVNVRYNQTRGWRHAITGGGHWSYLVYEYNTCYKDVGTDGSIDMHGTCTGIIRRNSVIDDAPWAQFGGGYSIRGNGILCEENEYFTNTDLTKQYSVSAFFTGDNFRSGTFRYNRVRAISFDPQDVTPNSGSTDNYPDIRSISFYSNDADMPLTDIHVYENHFSGAIVFMKQLSSKPAVKIGTNVNIYNNYFDRDKPLYNSYIRITADVTEIASYRIENNTFKNDKDNSVLAITTSGAAPNYSIDLGSVVPTGACLVKDNKFYKTNGANTRVQLLPVTPVANTTYTNNQEIFDTPPAFPVVPPVATLRIVGRKVKIS